MTQQKETPPEITLLGDPVLRKKAAPVSSIVKKELEPLIAHMRQAMMAHEGIGIAAPQLSVSKRIFLIAPWLFPEETQKNIPSEVFINPKMKRKSFKRIEEEEGCLSVPNVRGMVPRAARVTVAAHDLNGNRFKLTATDWLARVLQHEVDHLDGVLYIDRARKGSFYKILPDGTQKLWDPPKNT